MQCYRPSTLGAQPVGPAIAEATGFAGHAWRLAVRWSCATQVGWKYRGGGEPPEFFGLIRDALDEEPNGGKEE
ncbi:MAG: hypothetical protein HQL36_02535 [Alphaproteobacteria bacterium]|nr:hypothetical protein [Alphaproteobacteria bacterium]MBF0251133.1 hypothetical protein [Alphaproteobacteria bacterium]